VLDGKAFERLGRDQRQRPAGRGAVVEVVTIAGKALAGASFDALHWCRNLAERSDVDLLDATHRRSLPAVPTATAGLDRDDVSRPQVDGRLRWKLATVEEVAARRAVLAPVAAARRALAPLAQDREPAVLERAQLADDAVAAAMRAAATATETQRVALDTERVRELQRLDRSRQRVRHRDVHARRPVRIPACALAAADRLVVGEAVVPDRDVVHRALTLRGHRHGAAERGEDDIDDAARRLDVAACDRGGRARVDEAARGRMHGHR